MRSDRWMVWLPAALVAFCLTASAHGAGLQFINPDLGDGYVFGAGGDVSGDGSVLVGWSSRPDGGYRAFRWTAAGGVEVLPTPAGWDSAAAYRTSRDGQSVSVDLWNGNVTETQAARWTRGTGVVPVTPPPGGIGFSWGAYPNADGSVIAGRWVYDDAYHEKVYRWTAAGGAVGLPMPAGYDDSVAAAISDDGQVIVGRVRNTLDAGRERAAVWKGNTVRLVPGTEDFDGWATAVSADGSMVVGYLQAEPGATMEAFRWSESRGLERLGSFAAQEGAQAWDVSADGSVIVGNIVRQGGEGDTVFVWDAEHGMRHLTDVLNAAGIDTTGYGFLSLTGVSSDGRTFAGTGGPDLNEAFIAVVPEPAAGAALIVLPLVALRRRRRLL